MAKELPLDCRCPACGHVSSVTKITALTSPGAMSLPVPPSRQPANSSFDHADSGNGGYISSAEAACYLKMHVKTLLAKVRQGVFSAHGEGRRRKFLRHELDQVMQRIASAKVANKPAEGTSTKRDNIKSEQP